MQFDVDMQIFVFLFIMAQQSVDNQYIVHLQLQERVRGLARGNQEICTVRGRASWLHDLCVHALASSLLFELRDRVPDC